MKTIITLKKIFLTIILILYSVNGLWNSNPQVVSALGTSIPPMLGSYIQGYINQDTINNELRALDTWTGKQTSLAAFSSDIEDPNILTSLPTQLNLLWSNGYTPYINLTVGYFSSPTSTQLASGAYDAVITRWATAYSNWASNGKFAFIALLPDMNSPWVSFGNDPTNYQTAYIRIQTLFLQNGIPSSSVRWVFSPNGDRDFPFTQYFPGNDKVDIVGLSVFNYGYCTADSSPSWDEPKKLIDYGIQKLRTLAPDKPIFITKLGSTAIINKGVTDTQAKNQWLEEAYDYLAGYLGVQAILYYNMDLTWECNWAVYKLNGAQYQGYKDGVNNSAYQYTPPEDLSQLELTIHISTIFLPLVLNNFYSCQSSHPMLLAIYTQEWPGLQTTMDNEAHPMDAWAKKNSSMIGTYIDIEVVDTSGHVTSQLRRIWENGYTPFVNLSSTRTASRIASGRHDTAIRNWARAFKQYAEEDGGRMAFIAPLQEMNGTWVPYGRDPANFKLAYARIRNLFSQEGVPADSVRWTFAPNGSGDAFEKYYPGDSIVDVVAFSSYNWGYYPSNPYPKWETANQIYLPYMDRMRVMAPTKPIIIAQTATSAYTSTGYNAEAKNQWLRDAYALTSNYSGFLGIIYDNRTDDNGYDFSVYIRTNPAMQFQGYVDAAADQNICYLSPQQLKASDLYQLTIP